PALHHYLLVRVLHPLVFFTDTPPPHVHALSLHDALPISWAIRSSSAPSMARCMLRWTVATSLTDSAIMRVSSCTRVKRSNSSGRSEEHTSELQSRENLVCRLLLEKKNTPSADSQNKAMRT